MYIHASANVTDHVNVTFYIQARNTSEPREYSHQVFGCDNSMRCDLNSPYPVTRIADGWHTSVLNVTHEFNIWIAITTEIRGHTGPVVCEMVMANCIQDNNTNPVVPKNLRMGHITNEGSLIVEWDRLSCGRLGSTFSYVIYVCNSEDCNR